MNTSHRPRRRPSLHAAAWLLVALVPLGPSACLAPGAVRIDLFGPRHADLEETVVREGRGPKVLLLEVDGRIRSEPARRPFDGSRESTTARVREALDKARKDPQLRGLLLRIDSPGGSVTASEIIFREIAAFKEERDLPVVAQFMGLAASGGYYVAMAADRLVAYPTSVTGSIGVIFVNVSAAGLLEKIGIEDQTLTSGPSKDAASPLRRMTEAEREHLQAVLGDLFDRFTRVVAEGRPGLGVEAFEELASGRVYSAEQAHRLGLIDRVGDIEEALEDLGALIEAEDLRVVTYHRPREWRRTLYSQASVETPIGVDLGGLADFLPEPGFHYLWWPGGR